MISLPCQRSHCPCGQSLKGIHYLPICHGTFLEAAISPRGKRDFFLMCSQIQFITVKEK